MGVRQVYRGNPALKSTYLISDLANGIDTVNSDEVISTKSMRDLVNVELGEAGIIKKRKGFSKDNILNRIIREYYIFEENLDLELSTYLDDAYGVFLLSDKKNVLSRVEEYETLEDFKLGYGVNSEYGKVLFNIDLLIVTVKEGVQLNFTRLNINHSEDGIKVTFNEMLKEGYIIRIDGKLKKRKITGLRAIDFDNKIYIELSQIAESLKGFVEIGIEDDEYYIKILNTSIVEEEEGIYDRGIYEPTPYEVLNYGFNVLSDDPLNKISYTSGAKRIFSFYLTDYDNPKIPLTKIPSNGRFRIVAIVSGFTQPDELKLKIFQKGNLTYKDGVPELKDNELTFTATSESPQGNSAIFHYKIELNIPNNNEITIELYEELEDEVVSRSFESKEAFVNKVRVRRAHVGSSNQSGLEAVKNIYINFDMGSGDIYFSERIATIQQPQEYPMNDKDGNWTLGYAASHQFSAMVVGDYALRDDIDAFFTDYPTLKDGRFHEILAEDGGFYRETARGYFWNTLEKKGYYFMRRPSDVYMWDDIDAVPNRVSDNLKADVWSVGDIIKVKINGSYEFLEFTGGDKFEAVFENDATVDEKYEAIVSKHFYKIQDGESMIYSPIRFTLTFDSGSEEDLKEVTPLDITNIRSVIINDRMVFFKENTIWYSDVFKFNYFPFYNYITLPLRTDDNIVEIHYFKGAHIIFTRQEIWKIEGMLGYDNMMVSKVNDLIGCIAPETVQPQNNTLVFLSQDGLYALKQTMYANGLENVDKIDDHVAGIIDENNDSVESIVHNGIYHLHTFNVKGEYVESFRQYFNRYAGSSGRYPYTRDIYSELPLTSFKVYGNIYGIYNGNFYLFDKGYKDFNKNYDMIVETPQYTLDYPMHEKKIKDITIKVRAYEHVPVEVKVMYGDNVKLAPNTTHYRVNQFGEIEYEEARPYQIETEWVKLGDFTAGKDFLGNNSYQIHKLLVGGKTENVALRIVHSYAGEFNLHAIGFTFKLGKVRGRRN